MSHRLVPTENQQRAIDRMVSEPTRRAVNASEMGTGKSMMGVEVIKALGNSVNLITAPQHTFDGWQSAFDSQGAGEVRIANNKTKDGRNAFADLQFGVPGNYLMTRELARLQDWSGVKVGTWIADEAHSMTNPKSRGFKSAQTVRADYQLLQSGTIFGSSFEGAWPIARIQWPELDGPGEVADISRYRWQYTWCQQEYDRFAPMNKRVVGEKNPGAFVNALPCYVRIESDLPELEPIPVYYDLTPRQRKLYKQMEEQSLAWLRSNPLTVDIPIVQRIRLREIALAECDVDDTGSVFFPEDAHSALLDTILEMLTETDEKILMGTHSAKFARYLAKRVPSVFAWTGEESSISKDAAKSDFISGDLRSIVATQKGIGEGVDSLQRASRILFELSLDDSPILNQQFRSRLNRNGQSQHVLDYRFIGRDTLDDPQHESLLQKELAIRSSLAIA